MVVRHHRRRKRPGAALAAGLALCLFLLGLTGCATMDRALSWFGYDAGSTPQTPQALAMKGVEELNRGRYHSALKIFQDIKERFPFSEVGLLAELKAADANYYLKNYDEALSLYKQFETNHPTNEAIPYVLFQMGMCYYQKIDTIDRDPAGAVGAIEMFSRLVRAFPDSPYRQEAEARIRAARDFLARHEMYVATFYVKTGEYDQARRRLEYLLATYPETPVAVKAKQLLAAIKAGNPPRRTWRSWLPDLSLGSWSSFIKSFSPSPVGTGGGPEGQ